MPGELQRSPGKWNVFEGVKSLANNDNLENDHENSSLDESPSNELIVDSCSRETVRTRSEPQESKINCSSITELVAGQIVAERYQILGLVGHGAMGTVYRVEQLSLRKHLALKTLNPTSYSDTSMRRFHNEALAASRLEHPNLVRALDYGCLGKQPYLVMDFVEGQTLAQVLKELVRLPEERMFSIFINVCLGLDYAHRQGVIHRDLKPSNIILVRDVTNTDEFIPKIVDLGIAKLDCGQADIDTLTRTGEVFGTPLYMSPEQCLGMKVDARSDIYSLGCVIYEALTGVPPFTGHNALETMMRHRSEKLLPLKEASLGIEFSSDLEAIVEKMLAKEAQQRYQDCMQVAHDLAAVRDGRPISANLVRPEHEKLDHKSNFRLFVALTMSLCCILTALAILPFLQATKSTGVEKVDGNRTEQTVASKNAQTSVLSDADMSVADLAFKSPMFSRIVGHGKEAKRIFDFGKSNIGNLISGNEDVNARGQIAFPIDARITFKIRFRDICTNPALLSRFRSDDLSELHLFEKENYSLAIEPVPERAFDDVLGFASHLKSLEGLYIRGVKPVTIRGLENMHIEEMTRLRSLDLSGTHVDGMKLIRYKTLLNQLDGLAVGKLTNVSAVIRSLRGSRNIKSLYLEKTHLTARDVASLSTMPNLIYLNLANNVIDSDFSAELSRLNSVVIVDLRDCQITKKTVFSLAKMRKLKQLTVSEGSEQAKQVLQKKLPHCKIEFVQKNELKNLFVELLVR